MMQSKLLMRILIFMIILVPLVPLIGQIVEPKPDTLLVYTYKLSGKTATGVLTADIKKPFVAISRDLLDKYPLYTIIYLYDCPWQGKYTVMDKMAKRHIQSVDIFYKGKKKNVVECLCTFAEPRSLKSIIDKSK